MFDHIIDESIDIVATPAQVWSRLTDFESYRQWNPFIVEVRGELEEGRRLTVTLKPDGLPVMVRPRVMAVRPRRELRWRGTLGLPSILDGEHAFLIEPLGPERVRFTQRECFSGLLVPGAMALIGERTVEGFRAMNEALRQRAEAAHARAASARAEAQRPAEP